MNYRYQTFIQTKWLGPTEHKPSRVKAWVVSNPKVNVTVTWEHGESQVENHIRAAMKVFERIDDTRPVALITSGLIGNGYVFTASPDGILSSSEVFPHKG